MGKDINVSINATSKVKSAKISDSDALAYQLQQELMKASKTAKETSDSITKSVNNASKSVSDVFKSIKFSAKQSGDALDESGTKIGEYISKTKSGADTLKSLAKNSGISGAIKNETTTMSNLFKMNSELYKRKSESYNSIINNTLRSVNTKQTKYTGPTIDTGAVIRPASGKVLESSLKLYENARIKVSSLLSAIKDTANKTSTLAQKVYGIDKSSSKANKSVYKLSKSVKDVGYASKDASSKTDTFSSSLKKLGIAGAAYFSVSSVINFGKEISTQFINAQTSAGKLYATLSGQGMSFNKADNFISKYIEDGLVSLEDARTAYANLASMGMDTSGIENIMTTFKDSASVARQSGKTISQAVSEATEGLKQGLSINVDNAGITKNLSVMEKEYKRLNNITGTLTQEQKNLAYQQGIAAEGAKYMGSASKMSDTYSGSISKLSSSFTRFKVILGGILAAVITPVINGITSLLNKLNGLFTTISDKFNSIFNVTSIKNMYTNIGSSVSDTNSSIADSISESTDAIATSTADSVNKMNGARAGFDELVSISTNQSSTGAGTNADSGNLSTNVSETSKEANKLTSKLLEVPNVLKRIGKSFKDNITEPLKKIDITKFISGIGSIKDSSIDIFNGVKKSGGNMLVAYSGYLGAMIGETTRTAATIGTSVITGIASFMSKNKSKIKDEFNNIFENASSGLTSLTSIIHKVSDIFNAFISSDAITNTISNIIDTMYNSVSTVGQVVSIVFNDTMSALNGFVSMISGPLNTALSNLGSMFEQISGVLSTVSNDFKNMVVETWDKYFKPFIDNLVYGIGTIVNSILDAYNTYIAPTISYLVDIISKLWDEHLKSMFQSVLSFVGKIAVAVSDIWKNIIAPFIAWIVDNLVPALMPPLKLIGSIFSDVFGAVADIISGILDSLGGFIDFITGVFTGDWKKAWTGMQEVVTGMFKQIGAILKAPFNLLITGLNYVIGAINMINIKVPDWVPGIGGNEFGFDIAEIPKLANGGVVTSLRKVIVGESGPEAVIPLKSSVIQQLAQMIASLMPNASVGTSGTNIVVNGNIISSEKALDDLAIMIAKKANEQASFGY